MLTKEENELITQVGPGTPGGELLRRYWHPVAAVAELTPDRPKKRVKVMDEELVLFRSDNGTYGLVEEHCSHRGASLYYGFLEDGCIRCPYHGWMYDPSGKCVEQPFEPAQSMMKHTIRHPAYPVEELGGLLFAYLGPPEKKTPLPRWDMLVRKDGTRNILIKEDLRCNWVQAGENIADVTHLHFLHQRIAKEKGLFSTGVQQRTAPTTNTNGAFAVMAGGRPWMAYGFQPFEWGLLKSWRYEGDYPESGWGRLLVFPTILRWGLEIHWRVPIDDTHTRIIALYFHPTPDGSPAEGSREVPISFEESWLGDDGDYHLGTFWAQDGMAWETQGPIFDRTKEHTGASDLGVVMFRQMLMDQIQVVQAGGEPLALPREAHDMIDLHQWMPEGWIGESGVQGPYLPREKVFDDRYRVFELEVGVPL